MKVKIKGLVFVGFAAAILSANAMAAQRTRPAGSSNTVTSQAFTEAKYEWLSDKVGDTPAANSPLWGSEDAYPSMKVLKNVADAVDSTNNATQAKSTADYQLGGTGGSWKQVEAGTYVAAPVQGTTADDAKIDIKTDMIVGTETAVANGTNQLTTAAGVRGYAQKYSHTPNQISDGAGGWKSLDQAITTENAGSANAPTTAAVKTYVDNALNNGEHDTYQPYEAAANKVSGANGTWKSLGTSLDSSDTLNYDAANAVTAATIVSALSTKQDIDTTNVYKVGQNGGWQNVSAAVADTGTHITTTNEADGSVVINVSDTTNVAAGITASSTALTEGKAVYEYVQSQTGGTVIPTMNTTVCNATTPCALVAEASGKVHWRVMAISENQNPAAGTCGDATGNCQ